MPVIMIDATTATSGWNAVRRVVDANPYRPSRWVRGAHAETILNHIVRREARMQSSRIDLVTPDGETVPLHENGLEAGGDAVLIAHGLEGSANSNYVRSLILAARGVGLGAAAFSFPGCEAPVGKAKRLYHSGDQEDLVFVVDEISKRYPGIRLWLIGISMGGNVVGLMLGSRGASAPQAVRGAVLISAPFDLAASARLVDRTLRGLYVRRFLIGLKCKARAKHALYPDSFDLDAALRAKTFQEFDTAVTAPLHGFESAEDYWAQCSCGPVLQHVRVPLLLLSAVNDPFHPPETLPREVARDSAWIHAEFPARGGHVAFLHEGWPLGRDRNWAEAQAIRTIRAWADWLPHENRAAKAMKEQSELG